MCVSTPHLVFLRLDEASLCAALGATTKTNELLGQFVLFSVFCCGSSSWCSSSALPFATLCGGSSDILSVCGYVCVDHLITCKLIGLCRVNVLSIWHLFTYELKAKLHKQLNNNKYVVSSSVIRMLFMQPKRYKCILCIQQQQPAAISVVFVSQCSLHSAYSAC